MGEELRMPTSLNGFGTFSAKSTNKQKLLKVQGGFIRHPPYNPPPLKAFSLRYFISDSFDTRES